MSTLFDMHVCELFECGLIDAVAVATRSRLPPCSLPSRTLRAADAVAPEDGGHP
jgi:hypothetical protein